MKNFNILKNMLLLAGVLFALQLASQTTLPGNREIGEIIKNDFLVNDDTQGDLLQREHSQVAMNSSGAFVVVWRDERNGDFDVFCQRYNSSGTKLGTNFRVNDDAAEIEHNDPDVAIDDAGNFVVVWSVVDYQHGCHTYGQRYSSDGTPLGNNFQVDNDNVESLRSEHPSVAMTANSGFVIVWNDKREDGYNVFGQIYNTNGDQVGTNFKINEEGETDYATPHGVGMDQNGNFVVCWADDSYNGYVNIVAQRYASDGSPLGVNFYVNDNYTSTGAAIRPEMDMNKNGEFVIGWKYYNHICAQRFDASGNPVGVNFQVTDDLETHFPEEVSVALSASGNIVISWYDTYRDYYGDVFAQQFDASGNAVGGNFLADGFDGHSIQEYPSVAIADNSDFIVTYCDDRGDDAIAGIRRNWDGTVLGSSFVVNDDIGAGIQGFPAIDMNPDGKFVIAWEDSRDDFLGDIYVQRYDASGNSLGTNVLVNDDGGYWVCSWWPDIGIANNGNFAVTWHDARNNNSPDIYAQRYSSDGTALGVNFIVNDDEGALQSSPVLAMDGSGNFVVAWADDRDDDDIYAQRYSSDGTALGNNFKVNSDVSQHNQNRVNIAMNNNGNFVIVWADDRGYYWRIYAQIYNPDGTPNGSNFKCSELEAWKNQGSCAVDIDDAGNFVVAWQDDRHSTSEYGDVDIYARMFDADGNPDGFEFRVNDNENISDQVLPSVTLAPEGGRFLIGWTDYRKPDGDPDFMAQKYINGEPEWDNVMINTPDWIPYMHQKTFVRSLASNNNLVGYAFIDNRRHKHWDIYGKLTDWGLVGVEEQNISSDLVIFPNPATTLVSIQSPISSSQSAVIEIYDLNGRKLLEKHFPKEAETAEINVSSLKSGVYFCRIIAENKSVTKKIIIQ